MVGLSREVPKHVEEMATWFLTVVGPLQLSFARLNPAKLQQERALSHEARLSFPDSQGLFSLQTAFQVMSEDLHYHSVDVASLDCILTPCSRWLMSSLSFEFQIQLSCESGWGDTPLTDQLPSYEEKQYQHKKLWSNPPSQITTSLNQPTSTTQHQPNQGHQRGN